MKYGHTVKRDGILYPAGAEVPVGEPVKVELTDDVPDGALDQNPEVAEPEKPKSGKKPKKE